jgi:hypothetical protein
MDHRLAVSTEIRGSPAGSFLLAGSVGLDATFSNAIHILFTYIQTPFCNKVSLDTTMR